MGAAQPGELARMYFSAWKAKDFGALRSVLADDVTFRGPLGTADDAESCVAGLQGMAEILTDIEVHKMFVDGPDVLTWFDLHTDVGKLGPVANWSHIKDNKIKTIRVTFDPRPLTSQG